LIEPETLYDRLEREQAEAMAECSRAKGLEELDEDECADENDAASLDDESDTEPDPAVRSSGRRARVKGQTFETLLGELVFSNELEEYFKLMDEEGASKAPKTRAQRREDEVSHGRLLTKYSALAWNSKSQYLTALRLYKVRKVDADVIVILLCSEELTTTIHHDIDFLRWKIQRRRGRRGFGRKGPSV
jgi:hypothetical protein